MCSHRKRNILTKKESVPHCSTLIYETFFSNMRNCSFLEEKQFPLVLSSVESILFGNNSSGFHSKEDTFIWPSLEKHQNNEFFNRWILSVEMKDSFYFKMTAEESDEVWEMGECLTLSTRRIWRCTLKNYFFDNDSSYSELEQTIRLSSSSCLTNGFFMD